MEKVQKQATTFFKEFQAFISKGNVVDLAVAVIVGAAFNNIISSLVKDIINPILGALIGKPDFTNLDRKSTRLNSSHWNKSRMPSSA